MTPQEESAEAGRLSVQAMTVDWHIAQTEAEIDHRQNFAAPENWDDDEDVEAEWVAAKEPRSLVAHLRRLAELEALVTEFAECRDRNQLMDLQQQAETLATKEADRG